jgi:hypothetical protein
VKGFDSEADYPWHAEVVDHLFKLSTNKQLAKILLAISMKHSELLLLKA